MTIKTIREWFEVIPDIQVRNKALDNLDKHAFNVYRHSELANNMYEALNRGFDFSDSPEGHYFWNTIMTFYGEEKNLDTID